MTELRPSFWRRSASISSPRNTGHVWEACRTYSSSCARSCISLGMEEAVMRNPGANPARTSSTRRIRVAELASGTGALVVGIGVGALLADWLRDVSLWFLVLGAVAHAWGMYDKHRIERESGTIGSGWMTLLYWACWLLLSAGVLVLFGRFFGFL